MNIHNFGCRDKNGGCQFLFHTASVMPGRFIFILTLDSKSLLIIGSYLKSEKWTLAGKIFELSPTYLPTCLPPLPSSSHLLPHPQTWPHPLTCIGDAAYHIPAPKMRQKVHGLKYQLSLIPFCTRFPQYRSISWLLNLNLSVSTFRFESQSGAKVKHISTRRKQKKINPRERKGEKIWLLPVSNKRWHVSPSTTSIPKVKKDKCFGQKNMAI